MTNPKFKRAAQLNRTKAILFTAAFHILLFGAITSGADMKVESFLPDVVKEWIGINENVEQVAQEEEVRP
jgi:hypothetical protein